ncbi:MAG TPA: cytochrome c biogenesis protein CcsA [Armatimonadota bacterium]|nr:cytochrome c biogenesis protein CcsA [Armatimonadota bacterium]
MNQYSRSLRGAVVLLLALAIFVGPLAFVYLQPAVGFQDPPAARILVFHLPMAWLCTLWFIAAAVYAVIYLRSRRLIDDHASARAAGIGLLCCVLTTVTGSLFAHTQWGSWWNWDPRETSIFYLLLIYGAYFALRGSVEDPVRRGQFSAVYALLAFLVMPFLIFVVPRIYPSLHPSKANLAPSYWSVLLITLVGTGVFLVWVFRVLCAADRVTSESADLSVGVLRPTLIADERGTEKTLVSDNHPDGVIRSDDGLSTRR